MIDHPTWRSLFYKLAEEYPDCLMLNFTVKVKCVVTLRKGIFDKTGIVVSAFKSTVVQFCAFFCGLLFFDGLECFLCFFSRVSVFFFFAETRVSSLLLFPTFSHFSYFCLKFLLFPAFQDFLHISGRCRASSSYFFLIFSAYSWFFFLFFKTISSYFPIF